MTFDPRCDEVWVPDHEVWAGLNKLNLAARKEEWKQIQPNKGARENGRGWANSRFRRWNQQDSGRTSYHRQYTLDNIAIYNRALAGGTRQQFASDYKWWFQSWNRYQKPRTYKIKKGGVKKTETHWAGVPPDAKEIGTTDDRDWHRAADRMAQVMKKLKK